MHKNHACLAICALLICALFLCIPVGTVHAHPAQGETAFIQIVGPAQSTGFLPAILTVHVFDYVIFLNAATPATTYSVSADDGSFASPAIAPGKQWAVTLTTPGTYEYHDTANPPHMVGEIIAVANSVSLLPTPAPDVEATAIALVQAGKTPPDSLALVTPTPTTVVAHNQPSTKPLLSSISPWLMILIIAESVLLLLTFSSTILIWRSYRRRLRQVYAKNEVGQPFPTPEKVGMRQKVFARFRRNHEDEDEEDEDYDEEA